MNVGCNEYSSASLDVAEASLSAVTCLQMYRAEMYQLELEIASARIREHGKNLRSWNKPDMHTLQKCCRALGGFRAEGQDCLSPVWSQSRQ